MSKGWLDESWWDTASRYEQICRYVDRAHLTNWVSVDDDSDRWPEAKLGHLVCCESQHGLAQPGRIDELRNHLKQVKKVKQPYPPRSYQVFMADRGSWQRLPLTTNLHLNEQLTFVPAARAATS